MNEASGSHTPTPAPTQQPNANRFPRKRKKRNSTTPSYDLIPTNQAPKRPRLPGQPKLPRALQDEAVFVIPFGRRFTQAPYLPAPPGCVGVDIALKGPSLVRNGAQPSDNTQLAFNPYEFESAMDMDAVANARNTPDPPAPYRHKRMSQFVRWSTSTIPSLIKPFLEHQRATLSGRIPLPPPLPQAKCPCGESRILRVTLAEWSSTC